MLISDIIIIRNFVLPWKFVYPICLPLIWVTKSLRNENVLYCSGNKMSEYNTMQRVGWIFGHVILKSYKR